MTSISQWNQRLYIQTRWHCAWTTPSLSAWREPNYPNPRRCRTSTSQWRTLKTQWDAAGGCLQRGQSLVFFSKENHSNHCGAIAVTWFFFNAWWGAKGHSKTFAVVPCCSLSGYKWMTLWWCHRTRMPAGCCRVSLCDAALFPLASNWKGRQGKG